MTHLLPLPSIRTEGDIPVVPANQPVRLLGPRINPGHFGLGCRITVFDEGGRIYYEDRTDPRRLGDAPPARIVLPSLPSGLYTGRLQVFSQERQITEQRIRFVKLPELVRMVPGKIGVCLEEGTLEAPQATMACIAGLRAGSVKIPVWTKDITDAEIAQGRPGAEDLLKRVLARGLEPIGVIAAPPGGMAGRLLPTHGDLVDLFAGRQKAWQPYLALSLTHYADVMRLWQIGMDGDDALAADVRYETAADLAARQITALIDGAQVAIACPAPEMLDGKSVVRQAGGGEHSGRGSAGADPGVSVGASPGRVDRHGDATAVREPAVQRVDAPRGYRAANRVCDGGGADAVFVPQPWVQQDAGRQTLLAPTVEYTAVATLSRALAGKHYAGKFEWTGGTVFHIFASGEDATLVAWKQEPLAPGETFEPVSLELGSEAEAFDLRGRRVSMQGNDPQSVMVGPEPIVITGANYRLSKLRSLFDVQPRQVASAVRTHEETVRLVNPYNEPINGIVRLHGPAGWEISPSRLTFSLLPGKEMAEQVDVRIPYNEAVGAKTLTAELSIDSRRFYKMTIPVTLDLQLPGIDTYAFADVTKTEVVIRHALTNRTHEEMSFVGSVLLPRASRRERLFLHVRPGQTMVKEYVIPREQLAGQSQVRVNLREINGPRVLNQMVDVF